MTRPKLSDYVKPIGIPKREPLIIGNYRWKPSVLFGPDAWRIEGCIPGSDQAWTVYAMDTDEAHRKTSRMQADGFRPAEGYRVHDDA